MLCVEELKLNLLAKSCLCPGLVSFIANLIASSGEPPKRSESDNAWLEDYWHGKGYEVYQVNIACEFHGEKFSYVAAKIYRNFRAILFALELGSGESTQIYNNPGDLVLPKGAKITGYVISEDKDIADAISQWKFSKADVELARKDTRKWRSSLIKARTSIRGFYSQNTMADKPASTVFGAMDDKSEEEEEEQYDVRFPSKSAKQESFNPNLMGDFINVEEGFHLSQIKINLPDVTWKSMDNHILATNHIILCGVVSNLRNFILPLRAKHLEKYPPIVILHTQPPTEKQWNQVAFFPEIYFVKGSAMNVRDLIRANIRSATRVVILSPEIDEVKTFTNTNETSEEDVIDKR